MRSKTTNLNPPYEIKLHRFTWPLYPKDLLFNTYNLIHVCDVATFDCSNEYTLVHLNSHKGVYIIHINDQLKIT